MSLLKPRSMDIAKRAIDNFEPKEGPHGWWITCQEVRSLQYDEATYLRPDGELHESCTLAGFHETEEKAFMAIELFRNKYACRVINYKQNGKVIGR